MSAFNRILLCYDGSREGQHALADGARLAHAWRTHSAHRCTSFLSSTTPHGCRVRMSCRLCRSIPSAILLKMCLKKDSRDWQGKELTRSGILRSVIHWTESLSSRTT